jgi:hypothetical protein
MRSTSITPFQALTVPVQKPRISKAVRKVAPPAAVVRMDAHRMTGEDSARFTLALRAVQGDGCRGHLVDILV